LTRAAELFVEKIATDRTTLNVRHYRLWDLVLANLGETLKANKSLDVRETERVAGILDRAQKGQRLARVCPCRVRRRRRSGPRARRRSGG
jgi:hypothetical protein